MDGNNDCVFDDFIVCEDKSDERKIFLKRMYRFPFLNRLLTIFFILNSFICNCQQIEFAKTYSFSGYDGVERFVELVDSGFILVGFSPGNQSATNNMSFIMRINKYGDIVLTKSYMHGRFWGAANKNDSTIIVSNGFTPLNGYGLHTTNISIYNGDTANYLYYGYNGIGGSGRINQCRDKGYIIRSVAQSDYGYLKVDSMGIDQWHTFENMSYGASEIKQDPYKNAFVALGRDNSNSPYCVIKLDSLGDTIWKKNYGYYPSGTSASIYAEDIAFTTDSNYLVCGDLIDIIKINSATGDSIWSKDYWGGGIFCLSERSNDTYIGLGDKIYFYDTNGDTLFTRPYPWIANQFHPYQIRKTLDKGFAYCGNYNPNLNSQLIAFVKCDSLGNTIFTSIFNPENNLQPLSFYPNPASNEIYLSPGTLASEKKLLFSLVDLQGRLVLQQQYDSTKPIDISALPQGLYITTLKGKEKEVRGKVIVQR